MLLQVMAARDAPLRRIVDELDLDGIIAVGDYVAQGTDDDLKLQIPKISADNSDLGGDSEFSCHWDMDSGALIYVPNDRDDAPE